MNNAVFATATMCAYIAVDYYSLTETSQYFIIYKADLPIRTRHFLLKSHYPDEDQTVSFPTFKIYICFLLKQLLSS